MKYKYLLFDLDHTLWDFESNSRETLHELFLKYGIDALTGSDFHAFIVHYERYNEALWKKHRNLHITREELRVERFRRTLRHWNIQDESLAQALSGEYLEICPRKGKLIEGSIELLDSIHKTFPMVLITNGFTEVQQIKIETSGLTKYFNGMITSEMAGVNKPEKGIFRMALDELGANSAETLMVGDSYEADIEGAKRMEIDQAWFVPIAQEQYAEHRATYKLKRLEELKNILSL